MRHVRVIGIGAGNPEHMTMQAITALNSADVLFIPTKGAEKAALAQARRDICARYLTRDVHTQEFAVPVRRSDADYTETVDAWHAAIAQTYADLIGALTETQTAAFLVWGDPSLYDSTIRILERVKDMGQVAFDYDVIPGITSIQALCASHRIPLNLIGKPVHITTGRAVSTEDFSDGASAVVMLDGEQAFNRLHKHDAAIYWGAYLGSAQEITVSGNLAEVADTITKVRAEARAANGWIMDTYLIRTAKDFDV